MGIISINKSKNDFIPKEKGFKNGIDNSLETWKPRITWSSFYTTKTNLIYATFFKDNISTVK